MTYSEKNKMPVSSASWIWKQGEIIEDDYAEFKGEFDSKTGNIEFYVASDSDYVLYINGEMRSFSQFPCYENHPVADRLQLEVNKGKNELLIKVYYVGSDGFSSYSKGKPGLYFSIFEQGNEVCYSNPSILSRPEPHYERGNKSFITTQLGYRAFYHEDADEEEFKESVITPKPTNFRLRGTKKCLLMPPHESKLISSKDNEYLFDLGEEAVGFLDIDVVSPPQKLAISYAEHLVDGELVHIIGNRDFSFEYHPKEGRNEFMMPFRRMGLRYMKIKGDKPFAVNKLTVREVSYPFEEKPFHIDNELRQKIYDVCVRTLKCCYHEHYEDCPWREQCLYALDSRNQILCGYDCFADLEPAIESMRLFIDDEREDGLLPICAPSDNPLYIPSFSLHFITALADYHERSGDKSFLSEAYPKAKGIIDAFMARMEDGLIVNFDDPNAWNFYEWEKGLDGLADDLEWKFRQSKSDLVMNCLFVIALDKMSYICDVLKIENDYEGTADMMRKRIEEEFYDYESGLFMMSKENKTFSILGNSLAILAKATAKKREISEKIKEGEGLVPISLSMKSFLYDALLFADESNSDWVLSDIDKVYKKMLDDGATTFYETEKGWVDFGNAGSLCHGWSALPIHYYHLLLKEQKNA